MSLLVDAIEGAALLKVSERTFHTLRRSETFPRPVEGLGPRTVRWRRADLEAWVSGLPSTEAARSEPQQLARGKAAKRGPAWSPLARGGANA